VQVQGLGVAGRQDQGGALALVWADRAEDVGGSGALVTRRDGTGTALGPPSRDLVLLANASFVGEPDFYCLVVERFFSRDCLQTRGETFFKILDRALGLSVVARPGRESAVAHGAQFPAERAWRS